MNETRWRGFIKDYNGSTMMQCSIDRNIKHETLYHDIRRQNEHIIKMVCDGTHYNLKVWPGLKFSKQGPGDEENKAP